MRRIRWLWAMAVGLALVFMPWRARASGLKDLLKKGTEALARKGAQAATRKLLSVRRSEEELRVLSRVVAHLRPKQAPEVDRLLERAAAGSALTDGEWEQLDEVAGELDQPLREAAEAVKDGKKVPLVGTRALPGGASMVPGHPVHEAQCWVEYQLRHPERNKGFSYSIDPEWKRLYHSIIQNSLDGDTFENTVLKQQGYEKNLAMLIPPPGSEEQGFIADSLPDKVEELVWGRPYKFVEVKARQELVLGGNVKAMLDYVAKYGGHLELWVRSSRHADGATRLTGPLEREITRLDSLGRVTLMSYP